MLNPPINRHDDPRSYPDPKPFHDRLPSGQTSVAPMPISAQERPGTLLQQSPPGVVLMGCEGDFQWAGGIPKPVSDLLRPQSGYGKRNGESERFIRELHRLKEDIIHPESGSSSDPPSPAKQFLFRSSGIRILCRGLLLNGPGTKPLVMILIENLPGAVLRTPSLSPTIHFTPRETAVVHYIRNGFTNKEIALALGIGVNTIKDHVKRIMKKMKIHTRSGIAARITESLKNGDLRQGHRKEYEV